MSTICRCSFCGASADEAGRLVATDSGSAAICADCARTAVDMITAADDEPAIELTPSGRAAVRWAIGETRP